MKSTVVYYSYSGNTRKVAKLLSAALSQKGESDIVELKGLDESRAFLGQCQRAFRHERGVIEPVNFDLSEYDLICIGTPVWAFGPAPAVNTFLDKCSGVEGKDVALFITYGSGLGRERCIDYMRGALARKGAKTFKKISIQQFKVNNKEFIVSKIQEALK